MISLNAYDAAMPVKEELPSLNIESAIHLIRGQRVMLDADLAKIYGVPTRRLNEQLRRNRKRFPEDFAFQLTAEEFADIRSQIATLKPAGRGQHRKYLPWVFTEHGAIMLASVLNNQTAIDASVRVVRAFVKLREMVLAHSELSATLAEIERRLDGHDEAIAHLFDAIRQLLEPPQPPPKPEIGFHVRETSPRYKISKKRI